MAEMIHQRQGVAGTLGDPVRFRVSGRCAMTAGIVAHHLKAAAKDGGLRVPHPMVGAQGIGEEEGRCVLETLLAVEYLDPADDCCRHDGVDQLRRRAARTLSMKAPEAPR